MILFFFFFFCTFPLFVFFSRQAWRTSPIFISHLLNFCLLFVPFSADTHGGLLPYSGCANRCRRGLYIHHDPDDEDDDSIHFIRCAIYTSYIWKLQAGQGKSVLQLRVAGSAELLTITCPSMAEAENMADLVDGYCRLVNQSSTSIWSRKGMPFSSLFSALVSSCCATDNNNNVFFARSTNNISPPN